KHPNRFSLRFTNERRIIMAAANICETSNRRKNFAKLIGPFPRDRERANPARTRSASRAQFRIARDRQRILVRHERNRLLDQKLRIRAAERIIFKTSIALSFA